MPPRPPPPPPPPRPSQKELVGRIETHTSPDGIVSLCYESQDARENEKVIALIGESGVYVIIGTGGFRERVETRDFELAYRRILMSQMCGTLSPEDVDQQVDSLMARHNVRALRPRKINDRTTLVFVYTTAGFHQHVSGPFRCAQCGTSENLRHCTCLHEAYCCEAHQHKHWPTHRAVCRALRGKYETTDEFADELARCV